MARPVAEPPLRIGKGVIDRGVQIGVPLGAVAGRDHQITARSDDLDSNSESVPMLVVVMWRLERDLDRDDALRVLHQLLRSVLHVRTD